MTERRWTSGFPARAEWRELENRRSVSPGNGKVQVLQRRDSKAISPPTMRGKARAFFGGCTIKSQTSVVIAECREKKDINCVLEDVIPVVVIDK